MAGRYPWDSIRMTRLASFLQDVRGEYIRSRARFKEFNSCHEGFGVIHEEFDELWDEIKKRHPSDEEIYKECVQVSAMALALAIECTGLATRARLGYDIQPPGSPNPNIPEKQQDR